MKYFSGFCFKGESKLFEDWLEVCDFCVAGFGMGAIDAFEYALQSETRIDKLQLFSPVFFQNRSEIFKKNQIERFLKNPDNYCSDFINRAQYPYHDDLSIYRKHSTKEVLKKALYYVWDQEQIKRLCERNTAIEVYLGGLDQILDTTAALEFFTPFADVYFMKNAGHLLR
ncbi:pimelyl-ACP methyl ester esterase BioV [Sulfurospirillum sp. 1612]|uniref:pimelyl-ACP methyl ester esterase BioV n=1 Tax=Sulfurospirillum sp. 1612 TaxID=3094835 RepID=UPI002F94127D